MNCWLIVFDNGNQEIFFGEDFNDIHGNYDSDRILMVIKLDSNIVKDIKTQNT